MRSRGLLFLSIGVSITGLVAGAVVACSTDVATFGVAPITGVQIRSDSITQGKGCGTAPSQVFKYTAVVTDFDGVVRAAGSYDCFADGLFQALTPSDSGYFNFTVDVYAFNQDDYNAMLAALPVLNYPCTPDGGHDPMPPADVYAAIWLNQVGNPDPNDGGVGNNGVLKALDRYWLPRNLPKPFTWETNCSTVQQPGVEVVAVCNPLRSAGNDGVVQINTSSFTTPAGTFNCDAKNAGFGTVTASVLGPAPVSDAGPTSDAGDDAGPSDAGTVVLQTISVDCPQPLVFKQLSAPGNHTFQVDLSNAATPIPGARATCTANTTPFPSPVPVANCGP